MLVMGAIFFGGFGSLMLLAIESKPLSTKVATTSLVFSLIPFALLVGISGLAVNAAFLVAALSSALAILFRWSRS